MAVTANQLISRQDGVRRGYPAAAAVLYEGTLAFVNGSGYLDDDTNTGGNKFGGIVIEKVDNSAGSAGDLDAETYISGVFLLTGSGFTQGDVGETVYATDNYTITTTAGGSGSRIGTCVGYESSTQLWVKIDVQTGEGVVADSMTTEALVFSGATGANELRVPTNLADALSIESTAGDILVIDTTTGSVAATLTLTAAAGLTLTTHVTMGDAKNIIANTTTGTKIGTAVGQKLGFWNATPVVQQAGASQAALTNSSGGTADGTIAAVGNTMAGDVSADINNNFTELHTLLNAIRTALVNTGIIKGAA